MQLYRPTPEERAAAHALLRVRYPAGDDAPRIAAGVDLVQRLRYETVAERNAYWRQRGIDIAPAIDPGWVLDVPPDERRGANDEPLPRQYECSAEHCQCWDYVIRLQPCRHCWAVLAYRLIINAKLDALAQAGAVDLRPAGRYDNCYDLADCWGRTIASVIYSPRVDRWRCEEDRDVAAFANWLTREEAQAEIVRPRARGEYDNV